jgi:hypothetical protein
MIELQMSSRIHFTSSRIIHSPDLFVARLGGIAWQQGQKTLRHPLWQRD